jgi:hypothetical protein
VLGIHVVLLPILASLGTIFGLLVSPWFFAPAAVFALAWAISFARFVLSGR